ncbi:patatin family protein [Metabacillus idriensis]|uniref:patatin-like phospholipase family protein n=1 Tax=Metabacillus idriensis TaxID=324768 RepID=UPI001CD2F906|nr:patatin family protein [Metabacillus idriensis]
MVSSGLVLEGGGMRGLYTAGVLEFFMEKDIYFPYVIGVSAGACMGASYVSRQKGRNRTVNINYVNHPNYLSFSNFIRHKQLFGMDFIFDEIPNKLVPFNFDAFMKSDQKFLIGTTDCETGKPIYYNKDEDGSDILTILRASSSLPFLAPMIEFNGRKLLDGGIVDSIPIKKSQADGNARNVVVLTRNAGYRKKKGGMEWMVRRSFRAFPLLADAMLERYEQYNETLDYIEEQEKLGNVFVIRPTKKLEVDRIEKNPVKLENLYEQGIQDAKDSFNALSDWLQPHNVLN